MHASHIMFKISDRPNRNKRFCWPFLVVNHFWDFGATADIGLISKQQPRIHLQKRGHLKKKSFVS